IWVKTKNTLVKEFTKIEKPIKEIYVLFYVNTEQGLDKIEENAQELLLAAETALKPVQELTQKLKSAEKAPDGLIGGTLYKIKKKFK
ncbi:MAG: hypothetical protein GY729_07105, partial [Desulfobacteraceae bacterium]|nr:hypothetical protein [Desulfobacteraceae bacterium]